VRFGNPGKPIPEDFVQVVTRVRNKEISTEEALQQLGIGRTYYYETIKKLGL
jgi:DNA-directed RNA polymerase subunit N (RpoN/RPB10)